MRKCVYEASHLPMFSCTHLPGKLSACLLTIYYTKWAGVLQENSRENLRDDLLYGATLLRPHSGPAMSLQEGRAYGRVLLCEQGLPYFSVPPTNKCESTLGFSSCYQL